MAAFGAGDALLLLGGGRRQGVGRAQPQVGVGQDDTQEGVIGVGQMLVPLFLFVLALLALLGHEDPHGERQAHDRDGRAGTLNVRR